MAQLPDIQPGKVLVRLVNHPRGKRLISAVKADAIGKLITVRGTVVRATSPSPVVMGMGFVCGKCEGLQHARFPDGRFTPPTSCPEDGCRSRTFTPQHSTASCIDWQRISLQVGVGGRGFGEGSGQHEGHP